MTTFEEAKRCPKCDQPGEVVGDRSLRPAPGVTRGARLKIIHCRNSRCYWFNQVCRTIQVNPDGTIPEPTKHREKSFRALPDDKGATAANLEALARATLGVDGRTGEIRGR